MSEDQHTEWKSSWRDEYLKWICGFANAEGGVLVVGRDDRGGVVGLDDARQLLEELPNKVRDALGILVAVNLHSENGRDTLEIRVDAHPNPISYKGVYYLRSGSTNQVLKGAGLDRFLLRRYGRTWDSVPVPHVSAADLDPAAVARFRQRALASGRLDPDALAGNDAALLERLRLTEGAYLKRSAVLLFHPDPERFVTGAAIKIGYFASETDLRYQDEVGGDVFSQPAKAHELILTKYLRAGISYEGIRRIERFPMPPSALREALLNAAIHRDYATPAPIQIRVYPDRLRIWNPGQLPEGWTMEKLLGAHFSKPHNPEIAHVFFRAGEIEAWGRGIERVFEACREAGTPQPRIEFEGQDVWFEFPFSKEYLEQAAIASGSGTPEVTPEVAPEVRLVLVLAGAMTRRELQEALGLRDPEHFRSAYLVPALEAGLVEMTIPDKPTSRLQKYRLTDKGQRFVREHMSGGVPQ